MNELPSLNIKKLDNETKETAKKTRQNKSYETHRPPPLWRARQKRIEKESNTDARSVGCGASFVASLRAQAIASPPTHAHAHLRALGDGRTLVLSLLRLSLSFRLLLWVFPTVLLFLLLFFLLRDFIGVALQLFVCN